MFLPEADKTVSVNWDGVIRYYLPAKMYGRRVKAMEVVVIGAQPPTQLARYRAHSVVANMVLMDILAAREVRSRSNQISEIPLAWGRNMSQDKHTSVHLPIVCDSMHMAVKGRNESQLPSLYLTYMGAYLATCVYNRGTNMTFICMPNGLDGDQDTKSKRK
jgi:hypothetical protein